VIDAAGRFVMPGIIDAHSHMGVGSWPDTRANDDVNEATDPLTPQLLAEDAVNLEDPAFALACAAGVTTIQVLPGSANLQGGQAVVLKLRPVNTLAEMKFEGAPRALKMAFGENRKRVYGSKGRMPSTRMGNAWMLRESFVRAREYAKRWEEFEQNVKAGHPTVRPEKDLRLETLLDVLHGRLRIHMHCYRKDDLLALMRIADEFEFKIASFEHCLEGYKLAKDLARRDIGVCIWPDWWGFKMEARDGIPQAPGMLAAAGVRVALHSDDAATAQWLYLEAAKAVHYGMKPEQALRALTYWPATILGIESRVGSLEPGKDADLAIFTRHPFDVYTTVEKTLIDGRIVHDAASKEAN
jgi:imidazolonepropionase-like amidohydrolase